MKTHICLAVGFLLYSWIYHNEQQQPCVVASSTPSTNDITPITVYAISLSSMDYYFNVFPV